MDTTIIILVALGAIAWLAFIVGTSVSGRGRDQVPPNITMFKTDDELETKRLDRTLATAVVFSAFLALAIPIYYLGEEDRQQGFVEEFSEAAIERGAVRFSDEDPFLGMRCVQCHSPGGVGGSVPGGFVERRSGNRVPWVAPSLNDVFYRYSEDEVRFWITFGRANTPMPAFGVPGGGPLNEQSIDDLIAYLSAPPELGGIRISQEEAFAKVEPAVSRELERIDNGDSIVAQAIEDQERQIDIIDKSGAAADIVAPFAAEAEQVLEGAGEGLDSDADGLSDISETELTRITNSLYVVETEVDEDTGEATIVSVSGALSSVFTPEEAAELSLEVIPVTLDPLNPETNPPRPDLRAARDAVASLEALATNLRTTAELSEGLLLNAQNGLAFLEASAGARLWDIDFSAIARSSFGDDLDQARRAVGLFNAYCARCHTGSWSAGLPYTLELGAGALAPALFEGRVNVQFTPAAQGAADALELFIQAGSEAARPYGVNGMGTGRMPAWGALLSADDIKLIAQMLRGLGSA